MAVVTYKCPNCGGDIQFDPTTQRYKCGFCISSFTENEVQLASQSDSVQQAAESEDGTQENSLEEALVYQCPSCGAEVVTDTTTAATFCYYCHNPIILEGKLNGAYLPDKVVPFAVSKKEAEKIFLDWVNSKRFVPKNFFDKDQIEKIVGIYFPYWVMDCDVEAEVDASAVKRRSWTQGDQRYTETSYYDVKRDGTIHLEDLTKNALKKANKQLVEGVMPFDTKDMKPFSMGYLSGFQAEKRDLEQKDLMEDMEQAVQKYSKEVLEKNLLGYEELNYKKLELETVKSAWEYVLLPVWVLTYKGKDKMYYYALNGQTKEMCGVLPVAKGKLMRFCAAFAVALMVCLMLGGRFIW